MNRLDDVGFVDRWFRHRASELGEREPRVVAVRRLSRGVSRQTWEVRAETAGGIRTFAVRRDHRDGSIIPTTLRTEYEVYRLLGPTPVPTTDALWFEDDSAWQPDGRPAYVRTMVDGDWRLPFLASDDPAHDDVKIAASKEHLARLAQVHALDWADLGFGELFPVPESPADCAENLIRTCLRQLAEFGAEPSPVLAEAVARLRALAPRRDEVPVRLCKGTNGHGEEVWRDGRIVALSDWELAAIGDPAYDFAQIQEMVPEIVRDGRRVWGWPEALEHYRACGGADVTTDRIDFYRQCYGLLQFVYTQHAAAQVRRMDHPDLRFVWNAVEVGFRSELRLARLFGIELMTEAIA
ncbi:phosphotransferase family protein [Pseudonocardia acidicola]|uniref:Phosphotransferase family protein n=1 Tax=Pseudonocardia acidicola TaxID=2724939 RepID=A0ABX1S9K2_9PSEU|nr:phosphotransferase family protein [Pseudonocardia acidicola]NMH98241.1 phosphotransferase family protein [Pseudonocardia acidicola]